MASYDSPGFSDQTPAGPVVQSTGAPGSAGAYPATGTSPEPVTGTVGSSALVVPPGASALNGDRVTVGPADAVLSAQADSYGANPDPLTGIGAELGATGAGTGSVAGPRHPNSTARP